jgi:hypothetical protein
MNSIIMKRHPRYMTIDILTYHCNIRNLTINKHDTRKIIISKLLEWEIENSFIGFPPILRPSLR